jgi:hypothetical protein
VVQQLDDDEHDELGDATELEDEHDEEHWVQRWHDLVFIIRQHLKLDTFVFFMYVFNCKCILM